MNKLYLVSFKEHGYDEYDAFVVCAFVKRRALEIVLLKRTEYSSFNLTKENLKEIKFLGIADDKIMEGIVLDSYNAG